MYTFSKAEKLCRQQLIESLFKEGDQFHIYPYRITWTIRNENTGNPVQILISIPKRNIRKAVNRNLIRRRIRESYRLNKGRLTEFFFKENKTCNFAVIYSTNEVLPFNIIEDQMKKVIGALILSYEKTSG